MTDVDALKKELWEAKVEIENLTLRLKNVEFLYRTEVKKQFRDDAQAASKANSNQDTTEVPGVS